MDRLAIVSVWNKSGLSDFVKGLEGHGIHILSTGGTAKYLTENGINVRSVDEYTGHPEILDGRVKTLHPKIHGGILARTDNPEDIKQLEENKILPVEFVIVNLYPFIEKVREVKDGVRSVEESLVEFIDIGGPTMIRAAAKNWRYVVPVCDPADYNLILEELKSGGKVSAATRQRLAAKVFSTMAEYDGQVARYFSLEEKVVNEEGTQLELAPLESIVLCRKQSLRYGENPHQVASLYGTSSDNAQSEFWTQLQGKEISYNNLLDMQGALDLATELKRGFPDKKFAVAIKHSNPCGVAVRDNLVEAFNAAKKCDPVSIFGGIIALSHTLEKDLADIILEMFVEVVIAPSVSDEAKEAFKKKKNVRLIDCDFKKLLSWTESPQLSMRNFFGDLLIQSTDSTCASLSVEQTVTKAKPDQAMLEDMRLAWLLVKHVKSNAIVVVKDMQAIGVGAGQMSRLDSARIAVERAREHGFSTDGAVAASDAFLPFSDTLAILNDAGVCGLVQPGGSINDKDVIAFADERGVSMLLTGERHFRH